jgi:hypothetical protein
MATATDNVGVTRVEFYVNGALLSSDTSSPYAVLWNSASVADGSVALTAKAYDAASNVTTSATDTITVSNVVPPINPPDKTPPTIVITGPPAGTLNKRLGTVTISTIASDNSGTAGITQALRIDNVLKTTVVGVPLAYSWDISRVAKGAHTIMVTAHDAAGNFVSKSVVILLSISNSTPSPTVSGSFTLQPSHEDFVVRPTH